LSWRLESQVNVVQLFRCIENDYRDQADEKKATLSSKKKLAMGFGSDETKVVEHQQ